MLVLLYDRVKPRKGTLKEVDKAQPKNEEVRSIFLNRFIYLNYGYYECFLEISIVFSGIKYLIDNSMKINPKKNLFAISLGLLSFTAMGQTNSFPASGNAGIGTAAPADLLEINSGTIRKGITIKGDGTSGVFNDIVFTMNTKPAPALNQIQSWIMSHRRDGYFTNGAAGESSLEFYALRSTSYYAPLSFKSNGDLILVSNKNAVSGNVAIGTTDTKGFAGSKRKYQC